MIKLKFTVILINLLIGAQLYAAEPERITQLTTAQKWIHEHIAGYEESFTLNIRGKPLRICPAVVIFYHNRNYLPVWNNSQATHLVNALKSASREGLNPHDYQIERVEAELNAASTPDTDQIMRAELDILLSQIFMRYASHLGGWRIDHPSNADPEWAAKRPFLDLPAILHKALTTERIEETLFELLPTHPDYVRLRDALARYRENGEIKVKLPNTKKSKSKIRTEQQNTTVGLSEGIKNKIRQIEINLERWRWLPRDLGKRYIMVNVPNFDLKVIENDHTVLTMRVVVGKPYLRTPVFSSEMTYLVINPYWNVPPSIAGKELLPVLRRDPSYLSRHNMEVISKGGMRYNPGGINWSQIGSSNFPFLLRQRPGTKNPLGTVKFMFPNRFNVYLHDTSQRGLFARSERVFSHGCIRIEKPTELLEYVLGPNSRWNRNTLKTLSRERERIVGLPEPIPVHIMYWTAWVDNDGKVQFRKDIYGRDKLLEAQLNPLSNNNNTPKKLVNQPNPKQSG